ncbi:MAG: baseplate J/gp47 family protein [Pseudonocardiaceae bacterium]
MEQRLIAAGRPFDYRARDAGALLQAMRALIPQKLPEWTGHESEVDFGNVLLELFAHAGDIISYYIDAVANESFLGTAQTRRSIIEHLGLIGYRLSTAAPASAELTLTMAAPSTAPVVIRKGNAFATTSQRDSPSVRFEYTGKDDLVVDFESIPGGSLRAKTSIPVEEGRFVFGEVLGVSDGTTHQRFPLVHPRLILRSLGAAQDRTPDIEVLSELGSEIIRWTPRESLAFSGPGESDFVVEIDAEDRAEVVFGESVPPAGSEVRATYRVGGGEHGNVARNTIQTITDAPELTLLGASVTNERPATGGAGRETIEHAVQHAPKVFRSMRRAVTAADYESLAREFGGVGKVRAQATSWNTVTLFVAPQGGGTVSDVLTANLIAYFEDKRSIGTRIEVCTVDYVPIFVTADVDVEPYYSAQQVTEQVRQGVRALLAFDNVTFLQVLYLSKFYEAIEAIDGVAGVNISEFTRPGLSEAEQREGRLVMVENQLAQVPSSEEDFRKHPGKSEVDPADYPDGVRVRVRTLEGFR